MPLSLSIPSRLLLIGAALSAIGSAQAQSQGPLPHPAAVTFPITRTVAGVTVRITDAYWGLPQIMPEGTGISSFYHQKGLCVRYDVQAQPGTAFKAAEHYSSLAFIDAKGDNIGYQYEDKHFAFHTLIDPKLPAATVHIEVNALQAPPGADGSFQEPLDWDVPLSAATGDLPVGVTRTTAHGAHITLVDISLKGPTASDATDLTRLTFRIQTPPALPDLTVDQPLNVQVSDDTGRNLSEMSVYLPQLHDRPGTADALAIDQLQASPAPKAKSLKVRVTAKEFIPSLRRKSYFRSYDLSLPLHKLRGWEPPVAAAH